MRVLGTSTSCSVLVLLVLAVVGVVLGSPIPPPPSSSLTVLTASASRCTPTCLDDSVPHCWAQFPGFCICADGSLAEDCTDDDDARDLIVVSSHNPEAKEKAKGHQPIEPFSPRFWWTLGLTIIMVLVGGVFAGLTIGIMSLDTTNLEILRNSGSPSERAHAKKIEPIRKHGHWVLTTLLLGNVVINEALPLLFDSLVGGGVYAVIISTALVVLFGEIIPNAVCARNGLAIGAWFAPVVRVAMWLFAPIAWPVSKVLDLVLGHDEGTVYARAQLKTLIRIHEQGCGLGTSGDLIHDEVGIISAVLDLKDKTVVQIMTPMEDVFMMEVSQVIDVDIIRQLINKGHSRIPVYHNHRSNVVAILLAKRLIGYNVQTAKRVSDVPLTYLPMIDSETNLFDMLNFFQEGRSHMAAVAGRTAKSKGQSDENGEAEREILGVITLEDVIEELIGEEIIDETDEFIDVHSKTPVKRTPITKKLAKLLVTNITRQDSSERLSRERLGAATTATTRSRIGPRTASPRRRKTVTVRPSSVLNTASSDSLLVDQQQREGHSAPTPHTTTTTTTNKPPPTAIGTAPSTPRGGSDGPHLAHAMSAAVAASAADVQDSDDYFSMEVGDQTRDERLVEAGWVATPFVPGGTRQVLSRRKTTITAPVSAPGSVGGREDREEAVAPTKEDHDDVANGKGASEKTPLLKSKSNI
ncbi:hypothetical protein HKX48_008488 [Thoreauomyces humboldtii]|nr:hypothetical protein HKX48_008488 [Thoreauomyces humboldtii]